MYSPTTLTFRHIARSGALEARASAIGRRLQSFGEQILQCHMTLECSDERRGSGALYFVTIDLAVPGAQIYADSLHSDGSSHQDIYLALRDAFANAKRQLQTLHCDRARLRAAPTNKALPGDLPRSVG